MVAVVAVVVWVAVVAWVTVVACVLSLVKEKNPPHFCGGFAYHAFRTNNLHKAAQVKVKWRKKDRMLSGF